MIITSKYTLEYDPQSCVYRVHSTEPPYCPRCGFLMSGYDTKQRKGVDTAGDVYWLLLRRFYCPRCKSYHIELPSHMQPYKQYAATAIERASDPHSYCPAENSTMRLWKK